MAFSAPAASAATLNILGSLKNSGPNQFYDNAFVRGTLTCSLGCIGLNLNLASWTGSGPDPSISDATGFSGNTWADLFQAPNSGDTAELGYVNAVVDPDFTGHELKYELAVSGGDPENYSWITNALYILIKIGHKPDVTIIKNTGGYGNEFTWVKASGAQGGLSHYNHYGEYECPQGQHPDCGGAFPPPVPLPAGLPLMLAALGVTALFGRRFRQQH